MAVKKSGFAEDTVPKETKYIPEPKILTPPNKLGGGKIKVEDHPHILKISNCFIAIGIDKTSGEVKEISSSDGDNVLKDKGDAETVPFLVVSELREKNSYVSDIGEKKALFCRDTFRKLEYFYGLNGEVTVIIRGKSTDGVNVDYWIVMYPGDPKTYWRMEVQNQGRNVLVDQFVFPYLSGLRAGNEQTDDWFMYPSRMPLKIKSSSFRPRVLGLNAVNTSDMVYKSDEWPSLPEGEGDLTAHTMLNDRTWERAQYPGYLQMQWMSLFDDTRALNVICHDDYGYLKRLVVGRDINELITMEFVFVGTWIVESDCWMTPWISISYGTGSWKDGADHYREWFEKAFSMPNPPEKIWDMPQFNWNMRMPSFSVLPNLFKIQRRGILSGIVYNYGDLPIGAGENVDEFLGSSLDIRMANEAIKREGGIPAVYTCPRMAGQGRLHLGAKLKDWVVMSRQDDVFFNWGDMFPCPHDKVYEKEWELRIRWLVGLLGVSHIRMDAEGMPLLCYSPDHNHRPNEMPRLLKDFYARMLKTGKEYDEDFTLSSEHACDYYMSEFETATNHGFIGYSFLPRYINPNKGDAMLMPIVFRYTFPASSALQTASNSGRNLWVYGYGAGYSFFGGGPCWMEPLLARNELVGINLEKLYSCFDLDWTLYYDWRVGFMDAVVYGKVIGEDVEITLNGETFKSEYPGPMLAVSYLGTGRQVVLGYWYHLSEPDFYTKHVLEEREPLPEKVRIGFESYLKNIKRAYLHRFNEKPKPVEFKQDDGFITLDIEHPDYWAVELIEDVSFRLFPEKKVVYPGERCKVYLEIGNYQDRQLDGTVTLSTPEGFETQKTKGVHVNGLDSCVLDFDVLVPKRDFIPSNYGIKARLDFDNEPKTIYAATTVKVMNPIELYYKIADTSRDWDGNGITLGQEAVLKLYVVNNTEEQCDCTLLIKGDDGFSFESSSIPVTVEGTSSGCITSGNSKDSRSSEDSRGMGMCNVVEVTVPFTLESIPKENYIQVDVISDRIGQDGADVSVVIKPRVKVLSLDGTWKVRVFPKHFGAHQSYITGFGNGIANRIDLECVSPYVSDLSWDEISSLSTIETGSAFAQVPNTYRRGWAVFRKRVFLPESFKGSHIFMYIDNTLLEIMNDQHAFASWIFINGMPVGSVPRRGEVELTQFIRYGETNLIAVVQPYPVGIGRTYLYVGKFGKKMTVDEFNAMEDKQKFVSNQTKSIAYAHIIEV